MGPRQGEAGRRSRVGFGRVGRGPDAELQASRRTRRMRGLCEVFARRHEVHTRRHEAACKMREMAASRWSRVGLYGQQTSLAPRLAYRLAPRLA